MTLFFIKCLPVWFLILVQFSVFTEAKPRLNVNSTEIQVDEFEKLEIICTSDRPIIFKYPSEPTEYLVLSPETVQEYELDSVYTIRFLRNRTLHGDTGWYSCAYRDYEEESDQVYVFVKSKTNYFVGNELMIFIQGVENSSVVIPCRPTSPDYKVQLMTTDDEVIEGENVVFDRTKGFIRKGLTVHNNDHLKCVINGPEGSQEKLFYLTVIGPVKLVKPVIIEEPLRHVTEGEKLRVNCTVEVKRNTPYLLNWTTPRQDSRITEKLYRPNEHDSNGNLENVFKELQIDGVNKNDAGEYTCTFSTFLSDKSTSTYLVVHDPKASHINLTTKKTNYTQNETNSIQWVVQIDAFPQPEITWLDPAGNKMMNLSSPSEGDKYVIIITEVSTLLKINNLEVKDSGNYVLRAEDLESQRVETLNFTLDVLAKPVAMILDDLPTFHMLGDVAEIVCVAAANPNAEITWGFRKFNSFTTEKLNNTEEHLKGKSRNSSVRLTIESTGNISCNARNKLGNDTAEREIIVTDVLGGFGVIPLEDVVIVGDKVELICAASIYKYTDDVEWLDENEAPVTSIPGRIAIKKARTPFTHRAILTIKKIEKSDHGKKYICSSKSKSNIFQQYDYTLEVHDPKSPHIVDTNMNKTEARFDIGKNPIRSTSLFCYAEGMPQPEITWWKDNVRINTSNPIPTGICEYKSIHSNTLYIDYLHDNCSGEYRCKATNRYGNDEIWLNIIIKGLTKEKEVSTIFKYSLVILLIICIIMAISFTIKIHREKVLRKMLMEAGLTHFEEGALECLNPELTVDDQAELLPYDRRWEFPRERLKTGKQLGCGAFGVVMKAEAQGICEGEVVTTVAVKMVRRSSEPTYIRALASELKIMVHLGKHLNVVNLLGACTKNIAKRELLVIVEYCRFGNLHNYLLRHRSEFINQIDPTSGKIDILIGSDLLMRSASTASSNRMKYASLSFSPSNSNGSGDGPDSAGSSSGPDSRGTIQDGMVLTSNSTQPGWRSNYRGDYKDQGLKPICTQDLLSWAFQVARGMEYLSQRKVLHGDLAARNILLAEDNVVKICDFGLAKTMYKDDNYKKKGDAPLPIKWMAIESIRDRVFSTQSDIWSYGIVLWEFFTLAETPYPGMEAEKQYLKLIEGYRMEKPEFATKNVYDIMSQCWKAKPNLRPTFTELVKSIGDLLDESVKMHYVDLNTPYLDMNTLFQESGKNDYLTMMSAPEHDALSSPTVGDYVNAPRVRDSGVTDDSYLCMSPTSRTSEAGAFTPNQKSHFEFPNIERPMHPHSDSDSEPVELSPMLKSEDDNYLKPINVHERRAEFARQREAMKIAEKKKLMERDSGYCNTPHNLVLLDIHGEDPKDEIDFQKMGGKDNDIINSNGYLPRAVRAQDNRSIGKIQDDIPNQKNDLRKNFPDSYTNPSYEIMSNKNFDHSNA